MHLFPNLYTLDSCSYVSRIVCVIRTVVLKHKTWYMFKSGGQNAHKKKQNETKQDTENKSVVENKSIVASCKIWWHEHCFALFINLNRFGHSIQLVYHRGLCLFVCLLLLLLLRYGMPIFINFCHVTWYIWHAVHFKPIKKPIQRI